MKPKADIGRRTRREATYHLRSAPSRSNPCFFSLFPFVFGSKSYCFAPTFSLDLLPEDIFGTDVAPIFISSDSSIEAEDATPEQRVNHQLRRRIRHLEHDLWNESTGHWAERERRMRLEVEIGSKILSSFFNLPFLCQSHYLSDELFSFFQNGLIGITICRLLATA